MRRIALASLVLAAAACTPTVKDFRPSKVQPDEGVVLGRVRVNLNGVDETEHCGVCFNSVNGPCLQLDKTGLVVMPVSAGPATLRRISCAQKVEHHYHFDGATLTVARFSKTYFGDVSFEWKNDRSFKPSMLFGALGAIVDQSTNDGEISMRVEDKEADAVSAYQDLVRGDDGFPLARSLVEIGH